MVKRTDLILSVGMLVLVLLALALLVATGSTGEFVAWAWERHHNVLSWYIRPSFSCRSATSPISGVSRA
jgi:hypothetical protein